MDAGNQEASIATAAYYFCQRRSCFRVCLSVSLSIWLLKLFWRKFGKMFWRFNAWPKDQVIRLWWQTRSRSGSRTF